MNRKQITHGIMSVLLLAGVGLASNNGMAQASSAKSAAHTTCSVATLASAPILDHLTIKGHIFIMKNLCNGNIFARTEDNAALKNAQACLQGTVGLVYYHCSKEKFLPFGGTVDSP